MELYLHPPSCAFVDCCFVKNRDIYVLYISEQGHLCTIYNHRFQVIEFGKSARGCESLGFLSGGVEVSALLGFSA